MRALVATIVALQAVTAHAGGPAQSALDHLDRGVAAYRMTDYETAHRELVLAQELAPDRPNPYRWLALTEAAQHDCKDALANIERFLSRVSAADPRVAEMTALRDKCLAQVSLRVTTPPPDPVIRVEAAPPPRDEPTPLYRKWWPWTAGGAIVAATIGVTYALTRSHETTLPAIRCDPTGCH